MPLSMIPPGTWERAEHRTIALTPRQGPDTFDASNGHHGAAVRTREPGSYIRLAA